MREKPAPATGVGAYPATNYQLKDLCGDPKPPTLRPCGDSEIHRPSRKPTADWEAGGSDWERRPPTPVQLHGTSRVSATTQWEHQGDARGTITTPSKLPWEPTSQSMTQSQQHLNMPVCERASDKPTQRQSTSSPLIPYEIKVPNLSTVSLQGTVTMPSTVPLETSSPSMTQFQQQPNTHESERAPDGSTQRQGTGCPLNLHEYDGPTPSKVRVLRPHAEGAYRTANTTTTKALSRRATRGQRTC